MEEEPPDTRYPARAGRQADESAKPWQAAVEALAASARPRCAGHPHALQSPQDGATGARRRGTHNAIVRVARQQHAGKQIVAGRVAGFSVHSYVHVAFSLWVDAAREEGLVG
jgi:hypothetical protein